MKTKKPKRKLISVTAEDIGRGCQHSARYCPIALAAKRALDRTVKCYNGSELESYEGVVIANIVSAKVRLFIKAFDMGGTVKPFKFYAELLWVTLLQKRPTIETSS